MFFVHFEEKSLIILSIIASNALFISGLCFVYFLVLPKAFEFFISFQKISDSYSILLNAKISEYILLVTNLALSFGIAFQMPIILLILVSMDLVHSDYFAKNRRFAIVGIFIVAGIITPPDILSQLLLAFPLIGLYEITILLARRIEQNRKIQYQE